jgi:hypothetical protein
MTSPHQRALGPRHDQGDVTSPTGLQEPLVHTPWRPKGEHGPSEASGPYTAAEQFAIVRKWVTHWLASALSPSNILIIVT